MVYTYTPTYYPSLQDSITSLCKTILPFSFKKRRTLPATAEQNQLSKLQSDNLKWQQESFHHILNLMGLCKEGIVPKTEVSAFRTRILESLDVSPMNKLEQPAILNDKLLFLQELFYAKCISDEEYQSSKGALLRKLAILQGNEIEVDRQNTAAGPNQNETLEEEWSVIDLKDGNCMLKEQNHLNSQTKPRKQRSSSTISLIKGAGASVLGMVTNQKQGKMESFSSSSPQKTGTFRKSIFQKESNDTDRRSEKSAKKQWGLKRWKGSNSEDEAVDSLKQGDTSEIEFPHPLVDIPIGEGPDTKRIKKKLHPDGSASDFFIDKVLGEKIKKELLGIQTELCSTNPSLQLSNEQMEAISTKLPVEKADLNKFFPKQWCDEYGDVVLGVVRKEFKEHLEEMKNLRNVARGKQGNPKRRVVAFVDDDDDENSNPNLHIRKQSSAYSVGVKDYYGEEARMSESSFVNPFCAAPVRSFSMLG